MWLLRAFHRNVRNHVEWDEGVHQSPLAVWLLVQKGIGEEAQCPKEVSGSDVPRSLFTLNIKSTHCSCIPAWTRNNGSK